MLLGLALLLNPTAVRVLNFEQPLYSPLKGSNVPERVLKHTREDPHTKPRTQGYLAHEKMGPYSRPMPMVILRSWGGGVFS